MHCLNGVSVYECVCVGTWVCVVPGIIRLRLLVVKYVQPQLQYESGLLSHTLYFVLVERRKFTFELSWDYECSVVISRGNLQGNLQGNL